jgi:hypothetical protein
MRLVGPMMSELCDGYVQRKAGKQWWHGWHCTALHCTALHCTALHCTALHCTALHCTALPTLSSSARSFSKSENRLEIALRRREAEQHRARAG